MAASKYIYSLIIVLSVFIIYWPGVNGPFLFDDQTSILENPSIKVTKLDFDSLLNAAESGQAGPLKRPVAMISFAVNYYFSSGYYAPSFKITNIVIHAINSILIFILSFQLLKKALNKPSRELLLLSAITALIWAIHPINLTSVLYVVQRMTSLSTLFSLICIIFYIQGRNQSISCQHNSRSLYWFGASLISLTFGLFSKEISILVPLFILLIELTLYSAHTPWVKIKRLNLSQRFWLYTFFSITAIAFTLYSIDYAAGGFLSRPFNMQERVLTELRVLCFYISLIVIPKINSFGLFHDDITLSASLLSPWTTLPSLVFLVALICSAFYYRTKNALYSLGIGWFFVGHLLESTFFPLEIAHEHRNYLPSLGIIIAITAIVLKIKTTKPVATIGLAALIIILGSTTWGRSAQWGSAYRQAYFETVHRPRSAAAQSIFAYEAYNLGRVDESLNALKKAMQNDPKEAAYALFYQHELASTKRKITVQIQHETMSRLRNGHPSPTTLNALNRIANCLHKSVCEPLRQNYIEWVNAAIERKPKHAYYYYFKGKAYLAINNSDKAFEAFQKAIKLDKTSINHLIQITRIFIQRGNIQIAEQLINSLSKEYNGDISNKIKQLKNELNTAKSASKTRKIMGSSQLGFVLRCCT